MNFMDLVNKRDSARRYLDKPVPRELVDQCLEAARLAPSACNSQPWSFIIIDDREKINEIVDKTMSGLYSLNKFVKTAPVLIVAITENSVYYARMGGMFRGVQYNLIDIGITCDHLTLRAAELDLGTCWLGWFNEKKLKKILDLPKSTQIDIVLSLGYPDPAVPTRKKIRKPMDEIRRYF